MAERREKRRGCCELRITTRFWGHVEKLHATWKAGTLADSGKLSVVLSPTHPEAATKPPAAQNTPALPRDDSGGRATQN